MISRRAGLLAVGKEDAPKERRNLSKPILGRGEKPCGLSLKMRRAIALTSLFFPLDRGSSPAAFFILRRVLKLQTRR